MNTIGKNEPLLSDTVLGKDRSFISDKPVIGLTVDWRKMVDNKGNYACYYYPAKLKAYQDAVILGGGIPVVILFSDNIKEIVPMLDGVLIAGGRDIDPKFYGQNVNGAIPPSDNQRFEFERELYKIYPQNLPIFGICWGMQFMNVIEGGTLIQDMSTKKKHLKHISAFDTVPGTWINQVLGSKASSFCNHHQAIDQVADGYIISSIDDDGIPHSMEKISENVWRVGVQPHPEVMTKETKEEGIDESNARLFKNFVRKAEEFKNKKKTSFLL